MRSLACHFARRAALHGDRAAKRIKTKHATISTSTSTAYGASVSRYRALIMAVMVASARPSATARAIDARNDFPEKRKLALADVITRFAGHAATTLPAPRRLQVARMASLSMMQA